MNKNFTIGSRQVGADAPVFIVAEMSANHLQDYNRALEILHAAKEAGNNSDYANNYWYNYFYFKHLLIKIVM